MIISGNELNVLFEKENLNFIRVMDHTFENNLMLIDSYMPKLYGELVKNCYLNKISSVIRIVEKIENINPIMLNNKAAYHYKYKKMIRAFVLDMPIDKSWDGKENYLLIPQIYKQYDINDRFNPLDLNDFEEYIVNNANVWLNIANDIHNDYLELSVKIVINF